eukprot:5516012-Ditylum_brightwellii.AAC.1
MTRMTLHVAFSLTNSAVTNHHDDTSANAQSTKNNAPYVYQNENGSGDHDGNENSEQHSPNNDVVAGNKNAGQRAPINDHPAVGIASTAGVVDSWLSAPPICPTK